MTPKYVVISGAGSGIGAATSNLFSKNGWVVLAIGRKQTKLEELKTKLKDSVLTFQCDISSPKEVLSLIDKFESLGLVENINCLVNNAGIYTRTSFLKSDDELWNQQIQTNLLGSVRLTRELLKKSIQKNKSVSVVNVASTLGIKPVAETAAYSASKAAMISWTQTLALELAAKNIRVNCVCPGIVDTPIHSFHTESTIELKKLKSDLQKAQPLGRIGQPEDVANGIYYFATEQSAWTTGAILNIDGGISLL